MNKIDFETFYHAVSNCHDNQSVKISPPLSPTSDTALSDYKNSPIYFRVFLANLQSFLPDIPY